MSSIEKYGRFNPDDGSFELVHEPPRKWVNLHYNKIGADEMYAEITNIGDGVIWTRDEKGRTCNLVNYDNKYLYIRDDETNVVFNPWGQPCPQEVQDRICRYYAAKTVNECTCEGLKVTQRVFCPRDFAVQATTLTVENLSSKTRQISVFDYAMFQLTGCDEEGNTVYKDNFAEVHPEIHGVMVTNRNTQVPTDRYKGYLVALEGEGEFVGGTAYRDSFTRSDFGYGTPKILWGWNADNQPGFGPDCCGLVQIKLTLEPGQTGRVDFILGQCSGLEEIKQVRSALDARALDEACAEQEKIARQHRGMFRVETSRPDSDALVNDFVKKQLYSYLINKSGFRDNLQVDVAVSLFDYESARDNLLRALASQYENGSVPHGFRPLNRLQYADKPAWTMLTIPQLVYESGDLSLLDVDVPYFESSQSGSVWDHMLRAMRFLAEDTGANGLCNQHHADWNDGLEATAEAGRRESVMVSQQLCFGLRHVKALADARGDDAVAQEAGQLYDTFAQRINEVAWDGKWYVRTICGDGYRIGSSENAEGKIFLNPQSWAILSGIADQQRAASCMAAVDEMIETEVGYRICAPGFSQYDPRVGRMSNSMPGHVENGGCYCHAAGFKGVADCMFGRTEEAWRTFVKTAPDSPWNPVSRSGMEPFSFTNFFSTVPLAYGSSGYPWRTGTAGWFTYLLIEWILGARRTLEGLSVDPCLPKEMSSARVLRTFRGAVYDIALDNSAGRGKGATRVVCDGQEISGSTLPVFDSGTHKVEVTI